MSATDMITTKGAKINVELQSRARSQESKDAVVSLLVEGLSGGKSREGQHDLDGQHGLRHCRSVKEEVSPADDSTGAFSLLRMCRHNGQSVFLGGGIRRPNLRLPEYPNTGAIEEVRAFSGNNT